MNVIAQRLKSDPNAQFRDYSQLDDRLNLTYYQQLLDQYEEERSKDSNETLQSE
jgi:hypothetical protein